MDNSNSNCHSSSFQCSSPESETSSINPDCINTAQLLEDQIRQSNNQIGTVILYGVPIVSLMMETKERLCLAQISSTLLKDYSYNEIHNRRVALGITCAQCTPVQLELLRRAGAMPVTSRRCGMITRREAERLCKSFLGDHSPPKLPENFAFDVSHCCAWGCRGAFLPSRYNSSRAKCIKCFYCSLFFSPNKFIFHSHRTLPDAKYVQPDAANFNSWRRHIHLTGSPPDQVMFAWEDVKAMFNGGSRKRVTGSSSGNTPTNHSSKSTTANPSGSQEPVTLKSTEIQHGKTNGKSVKQHLATASSQHHSLHPSASKRAKYDPIKNIPAISVPATAVLSSTSSSSSTTSVGGAIETIAPPIYHQNAQQFHPSSTHHQSLLARLNGIVSKPVDPVAVPDYSSLVWNATATGGVGNGGSRLWAPYLNPLPFHPYSYYNYLMNKSDHFSSLMMMNPSGGVWQQLVAAQNRPRLASPSSLSVKHDDEEDQQSIGVLVGSTSDQNQQQEQEDDESYVDVESTEPTAVVHR